MLHTLLRSSPYLCRSIVRTSHPLSTAGASRPPRQTSALARSLTVSAAMSAHQNPACCTQPPVTRDYTPQGTMTQLDVAGKPTDVYLTGSGAAGVILVSDIFGIKDFTQTLQVADRLAAAGFSVAVPDLFHGDAWPMSKMPMKPEDNFMGWVQRHSYDDVKNYLHACVEVLKSKGVNKFGCLGFCWGAAMTMQAGADPTFSAVGGAHPSLMGKEKEWAAKLQCPVILLPAKGDPMETVKEVTDTLPFGPKCFYQRFDDQEHGFVAARGDWSDPKQAEGATKAVELFAAFLKENLA